MIKQNQPLTLILDYTPSPDEDTSTAVSATIEYKKPNGVTGVWSGVGITLDVNAKTVTYLIPVNILDSLGDWDTITQVTFSDAKVIPGVTHTFTVYYKFAEAI